MLLLRVRLSIRSCLVESAFDVAEIEFSYLTNFVYSCVTVIGNRFAKSNCSGIGT